MGVRGEVGDRASGAGRVEYALRNHFICTHLVITNNHVVYSCSMVLNTAMIRHLLTHTKHALLQSDPDENLTSPHSLGCIFPSCCNAHSPRAIISIVCRYHTLCSAAVPNPESSRPSPRCLEL
jgi:hypothetical protein